MNLRSFVQAIIFLFVISSSMVWAQVSPLQLPNAEKLLDRGALQKIIDGEYAPSLYRVDADDDDEKRLMKQQINCLFAECAVLQDRVQGGGLTIEHLLDARRRLGDARLEYHSDPEEQRKIMKEQLENAKMLEESFSVRVSAGVASPADAAKAAYFRIKVELALLRLEKTIREKSPKK